MGMDYIPVYEGDEPSDGTTVKVSLDRVQRSGVRTEPAQTRILVQPVRARRRGARSTSASSRSSRCDRKDTSRTSSSTRPGRPCAPASRCSGSTAPRSSRRRPISWWPSARCSAASRSRRRTLAQRCDAAAAPISASRRAASRRCAKTGTNPRTARLAGARERERHQQTDHQWTARGRGRRALPHCRSVDRRGSSRTWPRRTWR